MSLPTHPQVGIDAHTSPAPIVAAPSGVALLVGPTATGPVHAAPLVFRTWAELVATFGDATPLHFEGEREPGTNHTLLAARLFFQNGGTTLGVVRTARGATAAVAALGDPAAPACLVHARTPGAVAHRVVFTIHDDGADVPRMHVQVERRDALARWTPRGSWGPVPIAVGDPAAFPDCFATDAGATTDDMRAAPLVVRSSHAETTALLDALAAAGGRTRSTLDGLAFAVELTNGRDGARPTEHELRAALQAVPADTGVELVLAPFASVAPPGETDAESLARTVQMQRVVQSHLDGAPHRFALLDAMRTADGALLRAQRDAIACPGIALYQPWLRVRDDTGTIVDTPPCGAVAGAFARTDAAEGIWMAPTLHPLVGIDALAEPAPPRTDEGLGRVGVNALRHFDGRGVMIWGVRTLAIDSDSRYITVRRLVNHLMRSMATSLRWVAFEVNDAALWSTVQRLVEDFLHARWRAGAFAGQTPHQAYVVRCGLGSSMSQGDVDAGRLRVIVGVAPLKPTEFVAIRIELRTAKS
ncbi:MAG: phage tail sheath subtilisin-like domain-containing protein [Gemmatimonadaceae bacterium]|jgi:hypothetical protein|nr:phage tail sheath subtilisin-like domain-containing protein [Gemmatimonadaceae bacterium]